MAIGAAMFVAKEAAKKAVKETAKQVAMEAKKEALKGKLKETVKLGIKEEVKGKVKEEIDENIVDTKILGEISVLAKTGTLKDKLQETIKRDTKEEIKGRVMEDVNDNFMDVKAVQMSSHSDKLFDVTNKEDIQGDETKVKIKEETSEREYARTPEKHGQWTGERGESKWIPDSDYIPPEKSVNPEKPYSNPDNCPWGEIMKKYGIDGISFKNGFPDFSDISRGTVEIEGFETGGNVEKNRNFKKADIALAQQRGCSPDEVKKWREENNHTWHECEDKKTMQKVTNEVHANVPHDGGRSQKD